MPTNCWPVTIQVPVCSGWRTAMHWTPRPVHHAIRTAVAMLPCSQGYMSLDFKLKRMLRGLEYPAHLWNPIWLGPLEPAELQECFSDPVDLEDIYSEAIELWDDDEANGVLEKTMQFYVRLYLQNDILVKIDRASMMCSLELRSPFLDLDVVNFLPAFPHGSNFTADALSCCFANSTSEAAARDNSTGPSMDFHFLRQMRSGSGDCTSTLTFQFLFAAVLWPRRKDGIWREARTIACSCGATGSCHSIEIRCGEHEPWAAHNFGRAGLSAVGGAACVSQDCITYGGSATCLLGSSDC